MADVATVMARPQPFPHTGGISTNHRDITDSKYRDLRRPRKVRFFANGDNYFRGKKLNITPHRYLSFNDLLNDLTGKLPGNVQLPYGVRQIFTPKTGRRVKEIEDLQDGLSYVCAGFESFKPNKYGAAEVEPWNAVHFPWMMEDASYATNYGDKYFHGRKPKVKVIHIGPDPPGCYRKYIWGRSRRVHNHDVFDFDVNRTSLNRPYNGFYPSRTLRHSFPARKQYGTFGNRAGAGSYWNGPSYAQDPALSKPKVITVIRNGPNKPRANVKILLNRRSVQSFEQLMRDIAEAFGPKWRNNKVRKLFNIKGREVQGVSDFFRDDEVFIGVGNDSLTTGEVQEILEDIYPDSPYSKNLMKEWDKTKKRYQGTYQYKVKDETPRKDDSKIDSGLGSEGDTDDIIYKGKGGGEHYRSSRKKQKLPPPSSENEDPLVRIEQERMRASEDERERARKRMQKRLDAERRAVDEERRKRGIIPLKPIQQSPERRPVDSERELSPVETRIRARKKYRTPRRESVDEPKVIVVVKGDDNQDTSKSPTRRDESEGNETSRRSKPKIEDEEKNQQEKPKQDDNVENKKQKPRKKQEDEESNQREKENKEPIHIPTADESADAQKEKKKKSKPKAVHKTKIERQISNADHATEKYEPGKTLGDGNFAIVKQCKLINTNNEYAMKIIDKAKLKGKEHMIENEIEIMKLCNHPNIARLIEEYETNDEIYLIMELVKGGDLFDAITQSVKFNEDHSSRMVSDLAQALFYLHSRVIVHRDLKPENLLVQRNKDGSITLKLADFGLAMEVKEAIYTVCGTPTYVAPEILSETGYGLEVDMWAIGVITYILLCGFPPFRSPDRKQTELFEFIKAGEYDFLTPYWDNISKAAKDLIRRLLIVDKKKRYTAIDVLCHPWIITRGGTISIDDIETHRRNLRSDLESQAKLNRESYVREHHKQG